MSTTRSPRCSRWADFQRDSEEDPETGEDIGAPQIYERAPGLESVRARAYEDRTIYCHIRVFQTICCHIRVFRTIYCHIRAFDSYILSYKGV